MVLSNVQCPLPAEVQMLFSDDEFDESNLEVGGNGSDPKIESVELAKAKRKLQAKEKIIRKTRDEIKVLYRINRRLNFKYDRLNPNFKRKSKRSKGKKVVQDGKSDVESSDRLKASGELKKHDKRFRGKKVVQDGPQSDPSDSEDDESGDSELEFNPKPVKKSKTTKSNAGKQCITSMDSNVHLEQSNSEDYNSETEQNDVQECISLSEQICESNHPLVQEGDIEDDAASSKYKYFVL